MSRAIPLPLTFLLTIGPESAITETTRLDAQSRLGSGVQPDTACAVRSGMSRS